MSAASASPNLQRGFPSPGPQDPNGSKIMDHVFFLSNFGWKEARENNQYDFIIVGSGFCGFAFARRVMERRLAQNKTCRILMIERGPFFLPQHFQNLPLPFQQTLGGLSETFPWTLSAKTAQGQAGGAIRWQHGMVPFFGGRSTLWSAWCPTPTEPEMQGWPERTVKAAHTHFESALKLLRVKAADQVDIGKSKEQLEAIGQSRPVYGALQTKIQGLLKQGVKNVEGVYRTEPAPLACASENGLDFQKYSTPGDVLELLNFPDQNGRPQDKVRIDIATECVVQRILQQGGVANALETSRGVLPLGNAKLILAMGTLPPVTLVRNSFPGLLKNPGERFTAHFITSIVARVPKKNLDPEGRFGNLELAANYIAGTVVTKGKPQYGQQFHIQMSSLSDDKPIENAPTALRYMPDVVATASMAQLQSSKDHVVFVCAVLGELDYRNKDNWFRHNPHDSDPTTNSILQVVQNKSDNETWDAMDEATFKILENVIAPTKRGHAVEYWHGTPTSGKWDAKRPAVTERRVDGLVHEGSTLHIGEDEAAPVGLDYCLRGTKNVYITGGGLWPQGGSWNPTMTMTALALDLADNLTEGT